MFFVYTALKGHEHFAQYALGILRELILDGNSEIGAHIWSDLCYLKKLLKKYFFLSGQALPPHT